MTLPQTMFEKIWRRHAIMEREDGVFLMHVARHLVHDGTAAGFTTLKARGLKLRRPDRTFGTPDHYVPTTTRDMASIAEPGRRQMVASLESSATDLGFTVFGLDDPRQGIIHVIGPEQGITQPGLLMVCGDSHTATHGALGALAFGIGSSEVAHVLATQTLWQAKPRSMRVTVTGALAPGVVAKDVILAIIAHITVMSSNMPAR
jgi:3-isopropylmalate/(R)-2-methylmalate dehydratase large subunit